MRLSAGVVNTGTIASAPKSFDPVQTEGVTFDVTHVLRSGDTSCAGERYSLLESSGPILDWFCVSWFAVHDKSSATVVNHDSPNLRYAAARIKLV